MLALQLVEHGRIETRDVPAPAPPTAGRATVRIERVALNHIDLYSYRGMAFARRRLPITIGAEGVGIVVAVGPGSDLAPNTRVAIFPAETCGTCKFCREERENLCVGEAQIMGFHASGCAQELVDVSVKQLVPVPTGVALNSAACAPLTCATVEHMLFDNAALRAGETILVQAGGSGIGSVAIQMAKAAGATVITTVGSEEKIARAQQLGADLVINYRERSFCAAVRRFTERRGVDVVFEHVGADTWEQSLNSLTKGGRLVICGSTTGVTARTNLLHLFNQQIRIFASFGGGPRNIASSLRKIEVGEISPVIAAEFDPGEVQRGLDMLASRSVFGKVLVRMVPS